MRLYARSDLMYVALPSEHGGCGLPHRRPVLEGAPAKVWELDCPRCTTALAGDPCWGPSSLEVPLTPDEERVAKRMEEEGDRVMHQVSAALAQSSIQTMRAGQLTDLREQEARRERAELEARYERAIEDVERLSKIVGQIQGERALGPVLPVPADDEGAASRPQPRAWQYPASGVASGASGVPHGHEGVSDAVEARTEVTNAKRDATASPASSRPRCASCGGSLRRPGAKGPTPKGTCLDCRARARRVA
jgi:hypothetical protein